MWKLSKINAHIPTAVLWARSGPSSPTQSTSPVSSPSLGHSAAAGSCHLHHPHPWGHLEPWQGPEGEYHSSWSLLCSQTHQPWPCCLQGQCWAVLPPGPALEPSRLPRPGLCWACADPGYSKHGSTVCHVRDTQRCRVQGRKKGWNCCGGKQWKPLGDVSQLEGTWWAEGEACPSGQHRGHGHTSSWGWVGSTSSPVTAGEACSAASEVEAVTRLGWWIPLQPP